MCCSSLTHHGCRSVTFCSVSSRSVTVCLLTFFFSSPRAPTLYLVPGISRCLEGKSRHARCRSEVHRVSKHPERFRKIASPLGTFRGSALAPAQSRPAGCRSRRFAERVSRGGHVRIAGPRAQTLVGTVGPLPRVAGARDAKGGEGGCCAHAIVPLHEVWGYRSGPSVVPVCASWNHRHYGGNRHYSTYRHWVVHICVDRFHRHHSGYPTLPNRRFRGISLVPRVSFAGHP